MIQPVNFEAIGQDDEEEEVLFEYGKNKKTSKAKKVIATPKKVVSENSEMRLNSKTSSAASTQSELEALCNRTVSSSGSNLVQNIKNLKHGKGKDFATLLGESQEKQSELEERKLKFTMSSHSEDMEYKKRRLEMEVTKMEREHTERLLQFAMNSHLQKDLFRLTEIKETRIELIKMGKSMDEVKEILKQMFDED
jgi:hypothetical protein